MSFISANVHEEVNAHPSWACELLNMILPVSRQTASTIRSDTGCVLFSALIQKVHFFFLILDVWEQIKWICFGDHTFTIVWVNRHTVRVKEWWLGDWNLAEHPCTGKPNVLIQVKELRFGAGRIRSHSHMPYTDQWLAFSSHDGSD